MPDVCLFFQVHQPFRLRKFRVFDVGAGSGDGLFAKYFDVELNRQLFKRVSDKCYIPTNQLLLDLIKETDGKFKVTFSLTGVFLEQARLFDPHVLDSFRALARTGCVDFLGETFFHSLSSLFHDKTEFVDQVRLHGKALSQVGAKPPVVFRNTEALYSNEIAGLASDLGFKGIVTEGWDGFLGWRSPNYLYRAKGSGIPVFLRNYKLSDDVSYRFSARWWSEFPLTAEKYASWLSACGGQCVNLYMDYETFGEHQWPETGIFEFMKRLPHEALKYPNLSFATAREAVERHSPVGEVDVPHPVSWADLERDTSAWLGNEMQRDVFSLLQSLEPMAREKGGEFLQAWRFLQSSDHLYYACTKNWADGDVHKYFSPYESPFDGYMNFMNILQDFKLALENRGEKNG